MKTEKIPRPNVANTFVKWDPKIAQNDRIFKEALKRVLAGESVDKESLKRVVAAGSIDLQKIVQNGADEVKQRGDVRTVSATPTTTPPPTKKEQYDSGSLDVVLKGSKYFEFEKVKDQIISIEADVALLDTLVNGGRLGTIETSDFNPLQGERVHVGVSAILRETTSSSNSNLNYRSEGKLYVTDRRFVYLAGNFLKSIAFGDIERFTTDWLSNLRGNITIKQRNRARAQDFVVESAILVGIIYLYYKSVDFKRRVDEHMSCDLYDMRRHNLINYIFELQKPALDQLCRDCDSVKLKEEISAGKMGCGCLVMVLVVIGFLIMLFS